MRFNRFAFAILSLSFGAFSLPASVNVYLNYTTQHHLVVQNNTPLPMSFRKSAYMNLQQPAMTHICPQQDCRRS